MFLKVAFHYVETLTDKQVSEMDWNTKVNYLKRNPVTVARQIDYVFKQLWGNVILSRMHPIGVENWILKIEGSSKIEKHMHEHICMLLFKEQMLQELMKMRTVSSLNSLIITLHVLYLMRQNTPKEAT